MYNDRDNGSSDYYMSLSTSLPTPKLDEHGLTGGTAPLICYPIPSFPLRLHNPMNTDIRVPPLVYSSTLVLQSSSLSLQHADNRDEKQTHTSSSSSSSIITRVARGTVQPVPYICITGDW